MILKFYDIDVSTSSLISYFSGGVRAGFPSPAQDYMEGVIDLNKELVRHPASTFFARVIGNSMIEEGIEEGDILVIDKSLNFTSGDLAVCYIDGDFTVKRVTIKDGIGYLIPANPSFPIIKVDENNDFIIWGIVTFTIKQNKRKIL